MCNPARVAAIVWCPMPETEIAEVVAHLHRIDAKLAEVKDLLLAQKTIKDYYSPAEIAGLVGKAEFTIREWCRLGRIQASKKGSGRGKHQGWAISHEEFLRYQREGLLPDRRS